MNAAMSNRIVSLIPERVLGLLNANGRPVHAADLEDDEPLEQAQGQLVPEEAEEVAA